MSTSAVRESLEHRGLFAVSAAFAPASRPVLLCDVVPTDDGGVLVATASIKDGVQRDAVQKVTDKVRTVWQRSYDTGGRYDEDGEFADLSVGQARFAASGTNGGRPSSLTLRRV